MGAVALTRFSIEVGTDEGTVTIEGEGVVVVTGAPSPDDTASIVAFLDSVDPVTVEQQALARLGWGDTSLAAGIIAVLREAVTGETAP